MPKDAPPNGGATLEPPVTGSFQRVSECSQTAHALQAPVIMMSQNRQSAKDRSDARSDYEVNLRAEVEIAALHTKLDLFGSRRLAGLVGLVEEQRGALDNPRSVSSPCRAATRAATDRGPTVHRKKIRR